MPADDIERTASEWLARLDRADDASVRAEFDAWYAADHRHQVAFLRLQQTWSRLDRLAALRPRLENERAQPSLEVNRWMARGPAWRWLAAGIAIATLTTGIALFVPGSGGWEIHSTNTGGFERIPLQDGSILELNTQTEVAVELSARTRIVRLIRGEANFKVAHDARRPFIDGR